MSSFSSFAPPALDPMSADPGLTPLRQAQGRLWAAFLRRFAASVMRSNRSLLTMAVVFIVITSLAALDRQPNADYHTRRQALASKTNGAAVLLFASTEAEGPNDLYGYRADNNFFYLTGWSQPGGALLLMPATEAKDNSPVHPYTEIFFLPAHNYGQEKWTGPKLGPEDPDAPKITGFDQVEVLDNLRAELVRLLPSPR